MIDYQNLPSNAQVDWFLQPKSGNEVHTWTKPSGCNFVYIIAVGAGGGGGGGYYGNLGSGGFGGGGGAVSTLLIPSLFLPDTLFVKNGVGGAGGNGGAVSLANGTNGTNGGATIVSAYRVSSTSEYYLNSGGGVGGWRGTRSGSTPQIALGGTASLSPLGTIGKLNLFTGPSGITGNAASNNNATLDYFITGGAGAQAALNYASYTPGSVLSSYKQQANVTLVYPGNDINRNGQNGIKILDKRFGFTSGSGGRPNPNVGGVGGNGGDSELGCGGAGAAGNTTPNTTGVGGKGGRGGDGFVVIISY
jgi:hypothetical protein